MEYYNESCVNPQILEISNSAWVAKTIALSDVTRTVTLPLFEDLFGFVSL